MTITLCKINKYNIYFIFYPNYLLFVKDYFKGTVKMTHHFQNIIAFKKFFEDLDLILDW